jgi:catalase
VVAGNQIDTVCKVPSSAKPPDREEGGDLADVLVEDIIRSCPAHRAGTRPIHAPGIAATGWFRATSVASTFTTAAHFTGDRIPVTVRFSNGTGDLEEPDSVSPVRGMAVKFHIGPTTHDAWGVMHAELETDLISMTLPVFFVRQVGAFRQFVRAATPAVPKPRSWWQKLTGLARLEEPPTAAPGVPSNDDGLLEFSGRHPESAAALAYLAARFVPESYLTCCYHAVHTFMLTGPDQARRGVRFHWEPVDGVQSAPAGRPGNFLRAGLPDRISSGHAEFVLRIQVAEQGDDLADPTTPWSVRRPRVVMGHLRLTGVPEDQFHGGELLAFNPTRLLPGLAISDDPLLAIRGPVYDHSFRRRVLAAPAATPAATAPSR